MAMAGQDAERLEILRLVAQGRVGPEEALELLRALEAPGPAAVGRLRVRCVDAPQACEFTISEEDAGAIGEMLPKDMAEQVPARLLAQLPHLVRTAAGPVLLQYEDPPFALVVERVPAN
jgi:hypothetical protein